MLKSGLTVARQPSAESLRHRNCPVVDQTSRPPVDQKYLEKGDSLLWYVRSSESLSWYRNCLDNSFLPRMRLFASSNTRIIQARSASIAIGVGPWLMPSALESVRLLFAAISTYNLPLLRFRFRCRRHAAREYTRPPAGRSV